MMIPNIGVSGSSSSAAQSGNIGGLSFTGGGTAARWWQTVLLVAIGGAVLWAIVKAWKS